MSPATGPPSWLGSENPFPAAAVARVSELRPEIPTIRTPAIADVDRLVDSYLSATRAADTASAAVTGKEFADAGAIVVIEGEYGTGKTQLAMEVLDRLESSGSVGGIEVRTIYHVVPGGTFVTLYADLMRKAVTSDEVRSRVLEFYADVVAGALRERPFTEDLVGLLESGDTDPQLVVERYGLMEGGLLQELRRRLASVTGDEAFSKALVLLLHPTLRDAAWRWLCGGPPDQVLVERGVAETIETDALALEALGVLALLYGRKNRRFVLIIDEMEKVVLTGDRSRDASIQAFKKLLEVFRGAGAMLVSCGLPDILEVLPKDPGRIDAIVRPSPFTLADVRWYIEETQQRVFGRRTLEPFEDDSVQYLVHLSRGLAREVVKLCYRAFERAAATGSSITSMTIKDTARALFPDGSADIVRSDIGRIFADEGLAFTPHHVVTESTYSYADFWVPVGEGQDGCAIVVSESVLQGQDATTLVKRATAIRSDSPRRETMLVINGYLSDDSRQPLTEAFGSPPIVYDVRRFESDFTAALRTDISRIDPDLTMQSRAALPAEREQGALTDVRALREQTERIGRQQSATQRLVRELAERVDAVSAASDERLDGIKRALEAVPGLPGGASALPGPEVAVSPDPLPEALEQLFDTARRSLAAFGDMNKLLQEVFDSAVRKPGTAARLSLTYRLRASEAFAPVGVAGFLADLLASFREGVRQWLDSLSHAAGVASPALHERERLREICRTYDSLYGVTPVFQLDPLPELTGSAGDQAGELSHSGRSSRRANLRDAFDGLGDRVYQATVELAGGATGPPNRVAN
jgi:hypothetical protein